MLFLVFVIYAENYILFIILLPNFVSYVIALNNVKYTYIYPLDFLLLVVRKIRKQQRFAWLSFLIMICISDDNYLKIIWINIKNRFPLMESQWLFQNTTRYLRYNHSVTTNYKLITQMNWHIRYRKTLRTIIQWLPNEYFGWCIFRHDTSTDLERISYHLHERR